MMARSTTLQSEAGYIDARPQSRQIDETSCDARPDHTLGSSSSVTTYRGDSGSAKDRPGCGPANTVIDHGTPGPWPLGFPRARWGRGDRSTAQGAQGTSHTPNASPDRRRLVMSEMTQDAF